MKPLKIGRLTVETVQRFGVIGVKDGDKIVYINGDDALRLLAWLQDACGRPERVTTTADATQGMKRGVR